MSTSQVQALTTRDVAALGTTNFAALTTTGVAALTTGQMAALTTDEVAALTTAQVGALAVSQIPALTTTGIAALATADIQQLTTTQVAALTMTQTGAFTASQVAAISVTQLNAMALSPLVLNLGSGAVGTTSIANGVSFDLGGTGTAVNTGWITADEGFLVEDLNNNGVIDSGKEMFGTATALASGGTAGNGFAALASLDSNGDGVINSQDAAWNSLQVWVDANGDGISEPGELHSLSSLGITQINLTATTSPTANNGNFIGMTSTFETADGQSHAISDVWFATNSSSDSNGGSQTIDLTQLTPGQVSGTSLSQLNLANDGSAAVVKVNAAAVGTYGTTDVLTDQDTGTGHVQVVVNGTASDTVDITDPAAAWTNRGDTTIKGVSYQVFSQGNNQLLVDARVHVAFVGAQTG